MLLIVDEAQTGIGRTGTMYAFERDGDRAGSADAVEDARRGPTGGGRRHHRRRSRAVCHERGFLFFTTHVSDPLAASVALTVLDVVARDGLVERAALLGRRLATRLATCRTATNRSATSGGVDCCRASSWSPTRRPRRRPTTSAPSVTAACLERGLHMNIVQLPGMGGIFRIAPPLTIADDELDAGLDILDDALKAVLGANTGALIDAERTSARRNPQARSLEGVQSTFCGRPVAGDRALIMAIVNRTPDSFYDRGATFTDEAAKAAAHRVIADGADVVDVGGVKAGPGRRRSTPTRRSRASCRSSSGSAAPIPTS